MVLRVNPVRRLKIETESHMEMMDVTTRATIQTFGKP
jgi:hypothetical protein